jgi:hypothetical protein
METYSDYFVFAEILVQLKKIHNDQIKINDNKQFGIPTQHHRLSVNYSIIITCVINDTEARTA